MRVAAEYDQFRGEAPILRWIYRITTNLCLNRIRERRTHPVVGDSDAILSRVEGRSADGVDRTTVIEILRRMDALTQRIAVYYYIDEMNMDEVAETVGCSRKTVGRKLERFRKKARAMVEASRAGARSVS